jgi:hypothetical protein
LFDPLGAVVSSFGQKKDKIMGVKSGFLVFWGFHRPAFILYPSRFILSAASSAAPSTFVIPPPPFLAIDRRNRFHGRYSVRNHPYGTKSIQQNDFMRCMFIFTFIE